MHPSTFIVGFVCFWHGIAAHRNEAVGRELCDFRLAKKLILLIIGLLSRNACEFVHSLEREFLEYICNLAAVSEKQTNTTFRVSECLAYKHKAV